jgi:DNA repair exonuclease SbcCD nuclease subunit
MSDPVRVLLVADTHLGFDHPARPRVDKPRRGPQFFANFDTALAPALRGEVDLVVHGGDLLFRSKVPFGLVNQALLPLKRVADLGIPVFLVPGNHERSAIPFPMLALHPGLHVFDRPRTFTVTAHGLRVALAGFPCERAVRPVFRDLVEKTSWREAEADVRLLCFHQAVEGSRVGPADFTFRNGQDVVRGADLPAGFSAFLAGHIHRHQVLTRDLRGHLLPAPVFYPGSTERTSPAENREEKGFLILGIDHEAGLDRHLSWNFQTLPSEPLPTRSFSVR